VLFYGSGTTTVAVCFTDLSMVVTEAAETS
jgi:hypothetical protein